MGLVFAFVACINTHSNILPVYVSELKRLIENVWCRGDKGFCSEECRCRQIDMDEEDQTAAFMTPKNNTYKVKKTTNCSSYYSASASKTTRNRAFEFAG
uniref:FLZ-type domain-containing protein n=1 Tax=Daucus carota subsp. sativus TaxID=79200 RepID=A0A175YQX6_DAUCS